MAERFEIISLVFWDCNQCEGNLGIFRVDGLGKGWFEGREGFWSGVGIFGK